MVSSRAFSHRLTCSHCHGLSHSQSFNNLPHSCTPLLSKGLLKRWFVSFGCYCHIQALIAKRGTENLIIVSDSHPCLFFLYLALLSLSSQVCVTRWRAGWLFPTSSRTTTRCTACRVAPVISSLSRLSTRQEAATASRPASKPTVSERLIWHLRRLFLWIFTSLVNFFLYLMQFITIFLLHHLRNISYKLSLFKATPSGSSSLICKWAKHKWQT